MISNVTHDLDGRSRNGIVALPIFALIALTSVSGVSAKPKYDVFDPPSSTETTPYNINDKDVAVGYFTDSNELRHGFIRSSTGDIATIDVDGAQSTFLLDINSKGTAVGGYSPTQGVDRPFIRNKAGKVSTIRTPNSSQSWATAINASGAVAGEGYGADGNLHGFFLLPHQRVTQFDYPGADSTDVIDISDDGSIVGDYTLAGITHAFIRDAKGDFLSVDPTGATYSALVKIQGDGTTFGLYEDDPQSTNISAFYRTTDGTISTLKISGARYIEALGRNRNGVVLARYQGDSGPYHGLLWYPDGSTKTFDVPQSVGTLPYSVNTKGDATGVEEDAGGHKHGFVRTH